MLDGILVLMTTANELFGSQPKLIWETGAFLLQPGQTLLNLCLDQLQMGGSTLQGLSWL